MSTEPTTVGLDVHARAELMRARHRLSELLLRQGLLWEGENTWTRAHHDRIGRRRFT
ncbi:hypothetical protein [Nocardiopsis sp. CC223A]|uniref:hypothetical protein n=1 Tax=Nocardiopsis sp. CC223A TaxID=3044051 RepID=UPI00278BE4D4|nr:hypothetical protein [Nocardiopsis sp. CC223A]